MNVLVTGSRLPFAIEEIRKLGRCGHRVYACDSIHGAPGSHSKFAIEHFVTAPPRGERSRFLNDLERILRKRAIERLIPSFEEVFYIASEKERFDALVEVFAPDFATLARLHDKVLFLALARELGLRVPPTSIARNREELAAAVREHDRFFGRPAYSRGGETLFTNVGPLSGEVQLEECEPTPQNPFLVQPFIEGKDLCTYGIAHHGRLAAHSAYVHPLTMEHAGGIAFESVDVPQTVDVVRRIVEATGYHGQISLDFLSTDAGLVLVECNPRPTAGLTVMPDEMFDAAMRNANEDLLVAPPGMRRHLSLGLVRNMIVHWEEIPASLAELVSGAPDIYASSHDYLPLLYQFVSYAHVIGYRFKTGRVSRRDIMRGFFYDLTWDGEDLAS